jgi:hypothetical protein
VPEILAAAEYAFYCVSISVKTWRKAGFPNAVGLSRNVRHDAFCLNKTPYGIIVVALVDVQDPAFGQASEKFHSSLVISNLAAFEQKGDRTAQASVWILVVRPPRLQQSGLNAWVNFPA